jgi:U3 small nucleolar RNA-associated protein 10
MAQEFKSSKILSQSLAEFLLSLKSVNPTECDIGVAFSVKKASSLEDKNKKTSKLKSLKTLLEAAGFIDESQAKAESGQEETLMDTTDDFDLMLPPSVALEHSSKHLRISAVTKLVSEGSRDGISDKLIIQLLRRYVSDDDTSVASAAAEALVTITLNNPLSEIFFLQKEVIQEIDFGLKKWAELGDEKMLCSVMKLSGIVCRIVKEKVTGFLNGDRNQSIEVAIQYYDSMIQEIVRVLESCDINSNLATFSKEALYNAAGKGPVEDSLSLPIQSVIQGELFQTMMRRFIDGISGDLDLKQEHLLWFFLRKFMNSSGDKFVGNSPMLIIDASILLLERYNEKFVKSDSFMKDASFLCGTLEQCISFLLSSSNVEELAVLVADLCTLKSHVAYEEISRNVLTFVKAYGTSLYPYILLEVLSRRDLAPHGVERILSVIQSTATSMSTKECKSFNRFIIICVIALCSCTDLAVRQYAINFVINFKEQVNSGAKAHESEFSCLLSLISSSESSLRSSLLMDGQDALPRLLSTAVNTSDKRDNLRKMILTTCAELVTKHLMVNKTHFGKGICNSVAVMMEAMEGAGEKAFPLRERWGLAGKQIFDYFIEVSASPNLFPDEMQGLFDCIIVMLKGVTIEDIKMEDNVVIVTGPATSGRRRRSYSIGSTNGIGQIEPYPNTMSSSIVKFLEVTVNNKGDQKVYTLCDSLNRLVLGRKSWCNGIFPKLKDSTQTSIINLLLTLRCDSAVESSGLVLLGLPWTTSKAIDAMCSKSSRASNTDAGGLLALTTILECIRSHANSLACESGFDLPNAMFEKLSTLSKIETFTDGTDYARTCIITSLLSLLSSRVSQELRPGRKIVKDVSSHSELLVTLLGQENKVIKPLVSGRSKSLCLQLLTHLCSSSPTVVVESLIPVLRSSISHGDNAQVTKDAMMSLVPTYYKYASETGFCLLNLLSSIFERVNSLGDVTLEYHLQLYKHLITALLSCMSPQDGSIAVAIMLTIYVSNEAFKEKTVPQDANDSSLTFIGELLSLLDTDISINATLPALKYIGSLIRFSQAGIDSPAREERNFFSFEPKEICNIIINGPLKECDVQLPLGQEDKLSVTWTILTMIHAVKNVFSLQSVRRAIRSSDDERAKICLQIWQELMVLQSFTAQLRFDTSKGKGSGGKFFDIITDELSTTLLEVQNLLPIPHFLAAVASLIQDTEIEVEIQRRAILLLAERASETNNLSHEAVLFLEMVPDLVNLAAVNLDFEKHVGDLRRSAILTQCTFKAIDQLLKCFVLSLSDEKIIRSRSKAFIPSQTAVSHCLSTTANGLKYQNFLAEDDLTVFNLKVQVISSAALYAASLVTLMKAKCLSVLPRLVNPLVEILASANDAKKAMNGEKIDDGSHQSITLVQLSVLRALVAIAEHIPQFFIPYLDKLLTPQGLPSSCLRDGSTEEEIAVCNMADRLDVQISKAIPVRQLAPILSKVTSRFLGQKDATEKSWQESLVIFKILKISIENASRADIGPLAGKIISSLAQAYSFDCDAVTRTQLMDTANGTLLAMVMKLSEAQLRPLYARLREWRGDINTSASDTAAVRRRNAFWSLSAAMSKELRSIFLPCMSSVVSDVVKELELTASSLVAASSKSSKGHKRQKLETPQTDVSYSAISLQSLLLCLQLSLKADAHEGGNWIRGDEGQRYTQILHPLSQLLSATVPYDFEILPHILDDSTKHSFTPYERLIQGETTEDHGNVIDCLTALAAAAGNEQLWKPLNHALLEACGNEKRPEVRKSGVKALLSIIHTLGEEYMVLLPECLPVLSELLEDDDEDIVALAKECVQQGEELLGESLEDSLR